MSEEDILRKITKVITQIGEDDDYLVFYKAKAFDEITEIMQAYTPHKLHSKKPVVMKEYKYRGHPILAVNVISENDFNTLDDLFEITEKLTPGETMYFTREALEKYDSLVQPPEDMV